MKRVLLSLLFLSFSGDVRAAPTLEDEETHWMGFNSIVDDLNSQLQPAPQGKSASLRSRKTMTDPFDSILIHGGVGVTSSVQSLPLSTGHRTHLNNRGLQVSLGIDLFSEHWMAEGTARSFSQNEEGTVKASLKEFELKVFHKQLVSRKLGIRAGAGLTARYLKLSEQPEAEPIELTTPSSVATIGMDLYLTHGISLGLDVSARNTLIAETLDKNSYDATVRVDTHF